jgi:hypothetical protein
MVKFPIKSVEGSENMNNFQLIPPNQLFLPQNHLWTFAVEVNELR